MRARGYESMDPISIRQAEQWLASGDPGKMLRALLRLSLHGPDFAYAERKALEYSEHPDVWVRRNVATALSHVSRVHGSIDLDAVMMTLVKMLDDPEVSGWADDALDEVEMYMSTERRRYMAVSADSPLQHPPP
jgi:hypothetical protein